MKIKHPRVYAARTRPTWWLWMGLNTVLFTVLFLVQVLWDAAQSVYATWHWQYRAEWAGWFHAFGDAHRNNTRSLGARSEPGGIVIRVTATNASGVSASQTSDTLQ